MGTDPTLNTASPKTSKKEGLSLTMSDSQSPLSDQFDPESVGSAEAKTLAALASTPLTSAYPEMLSSNAKDDSPLRTEPSLLLSDPSIPKWTSDYSSKRTTGQQSSKSNDTASGQKSTDSLGLLAKSYPIPGSSEDMRRRYDANNRAFKAELEKFDKIMQEGFVPPLFDGEDPKLKYAGVSGLYECVYCGEKKNNPNVWCKNPDGTGHMAAHNKVSGPFAGMTEHRASAMDHQVGGDHYRKLSIQPVEFIHKNGLGFLAGNVIKYVCRYKAKAGVQDLLKAKHYIEMLIEQERQDP